MASSYHINHVKTLPRIGITMGDAAGIGPEIIVKALARKSIYEICRPVVIGSTAILEDALRFTPPQILETLQVRSFHMHGTLAPPQYGTIDVLDVVSLLPSEILQGHIDARAGTAALKAIEAATHLALNGKLDGIATAPICKAAIQKAGSPYPGHTEMLAALTNTAKVVMMLKTVTDESIPPKYTEACTDKSTPRLSVAFVTNHIPFAEVTKQLSIEKIVDVIGITYQAFIRSGKQNPRLAVAALNPHAGEEGLFGKEELNCIIPAIKQAKSSLGNTAVIEGPFPADTLFIKASQGRWDVVIAMYHEQGNIPIKLLAFGKIVNVTLGLPIIRTSVDHGTAFDIAGKGIANEASLIASIKEAASYC